MTTALDAFIGCLAAATTITAAWLLIRRWRDGRAACTAGRHRFRDPTGTMAIPLVFCTRRGCHTQAVAAWVHPDLAVQLHNAIPPEHRFPPVTILDDGSYQPLPDAPRPLAVGGEAPVTRDGVTVGYLTPDGAWIPPDDDDDDPGTARAAARNRWWHHPHPPEQP